ncbi:MAG: hypothetical protein JO257_02305 [Deltaproteobacteria bacterium]|nr:hypothetical protein [Deltaproteobacteria bacterium]
MDSMILMSVFGQVVTYVAVVGLLLPFVLYVVARWRAYKATSHDPQLGIKVALGYFMVTALQVLLAGGAALLYAIISSDEDKGSIYRAAFGLIVPGALVFFSHASLLKMTNQEQYPAVRRMLAGYNLLLTGLIGMTALVAAFEALFQRGSSHGFGRAAAAGVLVYGSAWAVTGWRFARMVLGDRSGSPENIVPPGPPSSQPPAAAPPAQPGLPPLGGGAFPPIR